MLLLLLPRSFDLSPFHWPLGTELAKMILNILILDFEVVC